MSIQSREQATNNVEFREEKIAITNSNERVKEDEFMIGIVLSFAARCIIGYSDPGTYCIIQQVTNLHEVTRDYYGGDRRG